MLNQIGPLANWLESKTLNISVRMSRQLRITKQFGWDKEHVLLPDRLLSELGFWQEQSYLKGNSWYFPLKPMFWLAYLFLFIIPDNVVSQAHIYMPLHRAVPWESGAERWWNKLSWISIPHREPPYFHMEFLKNEIAVDALHFTAGDFSGCYAQERILSHTEWRISTQTAHKLFVTKCCSLGGTLIDILTGSFACFLAELFQPSSYIRIHCFCVFKLHRGLCVYTLN